MNKRTCILVGDGGVSTGFANMNHAYVDGLQRAGWDVHMLALNFNGDSRPGQFSFNIYTTRGWGDGDVMGFTRLQQLMPVIRPDIVCVTTDPWHVMKYRKASLGAPMVVSLAVDGKNCRGRELNGVAHAIFWTKFGLEQARLGGYTGQASVVPLGVDTNVFKPMAREDARQYVRRSYFGSRFTTDGFILGYVGRNQPRKRLDLVMMYFAEWVHSRKINDARLFLHVAPTKDVGYNIGQLAEYLGIANRVILHEPEIGVGVSVEAMARTYACFDAQLYCSYEGWGLPVMEGLACGVTSAVADWAALSEWPEDSVLKIPCSSVMCSASDVNAIGGVPDRETAVEVLDQLYRDPQLRSELGAKGVELTRRPEYRWEAVGDAYARAVESALSPSYLPAQLAQPAQEAIA